MLVGQSVHKYWMGNHEIWSDIEGLQVMCHGDFGDLLTFFSGTTTRLTFVVWREMSYQLLDGWSLHLVQTFISITG